MRLLLITLLFLLAGTAFAAPDGGANWNAPDRGSKVAALAPGRGLPPLTRANLFADFTKQQLDRWIKEHPGWTAEQECPKYAAAEPADATLTADFPRHISPFGQVRSGKPEAFKAAEVLITYCPFCGSRTFGLSFDPKNPYHGTTSCCHTELYGHEQDFPADYALKPTANVTFHHLDDTDVEVPCTIYRDKDGVEWNLFTKTIFDQHRWLEQGCGLVKQLGQKFYDTADPLCAYKIAVIMDQVADTYYGLPLSKGNEICLGLSGKGLTRAEWESSPRPNIFSVGPLGPWNRRVPLGSPGWLNMFDEHLWVEPYARVRHHPAFKYYSQVKYGDPEALDKKIMAKVMRELCMIFESCFSQKLLNNYQEANYVNMWLLGVLAQDQTLIDFAGPAQEVAMYNHSYQDGLNGEGAPNYMAMPGGYFYPYMGDPKGWLEFYPKFLEEEPFYFAANGEMRKLTTVRGMQVEFGDQHEYAFPTGFLTDPATVRENEKIGSRNWAGYGVGIMRIGGPGHRQELCLDYTRATLHNAQDALSLECWVDGVPILRKGGYSAYWHDAHLQWERPEYQALKRMGYPKEIVDCNSDDHWDWNYSHSPVCQNNVTIDEVGTGPGWGDNRGYGELITFKGGEAAGEPGSGFQVLDARDHYSWSRVDKKVSEFRRTLIGVEGPDGRPYVLDLTRVRGEGRQALYQSAFADPVDEQLPPVKTKADSLAQLYFGDKLPEGNVCAPSFTHVRNVRTLATPEKPWSLTWRTDYGAYAPRDPNGKPFVRPWPEGVGEARLRLIGLPQPGQSAQVLRGQGPWIGQLRQALPGGQRTEGNVAFMDGRDFLIERRLPAAGQKQVDGLYVHILEGFREGETSAIKSVARLEAKSLRGSARDMVALELKMADGRTDTVIYQSEAGTLKLPSGVETDARYALLRQDAAGTVIGSELCRGTYLSAGKFSAGVDGDFTGSIVDVDGDLTGTRKVSALIIKPDKPWPFGEDLKGRQLMVRFESDLRDPGNEGYRIERVLPLASDSLRVELQDHAPFVVSWHQVTVLPADQPNVIRTWRPMVDHGNNPWYDGLKLWFPERNKLYTIKRVNEVGGGYGGDTVELVDKVNLANEGIKVGDWYVIYGVKPGLKVTVANDFSFRQEPASEWTQYGLRSTGPATIKSALTAAAFSYRLGTADWQESRGSAAGFKADGNGLPVAFVVNKPAWLNLNDKTAPAVTKLTLDGKDLTPEAARDLGAIDLPRRLVMEFTDAENPLDLSALKVTFNGKPLPTDLVKTTVEPPGKNLRLDINLEAALATAGPTARKHTVEVLVADKSVERRVTVVPVTFRSRIALDKDAVYLSDLIPVSSFAHGGLIKDTDYVGNPCAIAGRMYGKCLTLCPEPSGEGPHGEVVYQLPAAPANPVLKSDIGISESAATNGSVTFLVQVGDTPKGPWQTLYTSPVLRGGDEPLTLNLPLGAAKYLRLWTTDAGDGIGSDHAVWGEVRLKAGE